MYPMTDPRRKSLRGAPWDGPSLTCYKKRSPNMGTKTSRDDRTVHHRKL